MLFPLSLQRSFSPLPFVPQDDRDLAGRCRAILTMQAQGLAKRLDHTHSRVAVIGLSGGLDSTLALLVTVRAFDLLGLPREGIQAISMPCYGTTGRTKGNAAALADAVRKLQNVGETFDLTAMQQKACQAYNAEQNYRELMTIYREIMRNENS